MKKLIVVLLVITFFAVLLLGRIVFIFDNDTKKPIHAFINRSTSSWNGCHEDSVRTTNGLGLTYVPIGLSFTCKITVQASGYVEKSAQHFSNYKQIGPLIFISLNKETPTEQAVFIDKKLVQGEGIDVLGRINGNYDDTKTPDFVFTIVNNEAAQSNTFGNPIIKVHFTDQGGAQEISNGDNSQIEKSSDISNLMAAPAEGYVQNLDLDNNKAYVARLRDGKHYMKFTVLGDKDLNGTNYVEVTIFAQPLEKTNLNFSEDYLKSFTGEAVIGDGNVAGQEANNLIYKVKYIIASKYHIEDVDSIHAIKATKKTWDTECLDIDTYVNGVHEACAYDSISGYIITFSYKDKIYTYHVSSDGNTILEEN